MDARFSSNPASNAFKNLRNSICLKGPETGAGYATDTVLRLDSPVSQNHSISTSKGVKRKWSLRDESMDLEAELPLSLWLGHSSSSSDSKASSATVCTTTTTSVSSSKETDEEASMDLELDFSLHLGGEKAPLRKKFPSFSKLSIDLEDQVDLELSLSSMPAESDISTVRFNSTSEKIQPTVGGDFYMNEGSVSSHTRTQSPFPMLQSSENAKSSYFLERVPSSSIITIPTSSVTCLSGTAQQQQQNSITKICQFNGCDKGARGASGRCIAHGGGRRCQKPDCQKGSEGRTAYCKAHGGGRRCEFLGCTKSAEGHTDYCIAHGGGRRCSHTACLRAARGKSGLCIRHGGGKRCHTENCTKSAEGLSGLCISHGGGRRCRFPDCTKGAQGGTMYCKAHGGGKRCMFEGCNKGAEGSTPYCKGHGGGKRCAFDDFEGGVCPKSVHGGTLFCVAHGGGKRCVVPDCTRSARGRTDCCVRHGGGKRCKSEGCGKSAQGSTDFCKAHGGGKRCSWGDGVCNMFARSKTGMCTSHGALVQDKRVHGGASVGTLVRDTEPGPSGNMEMVVTTEDMNVDGIMVSSSSSPSCWKGFGGQNESVSVSEGRVHGGSLIALLAGSSSGLSDSAKFNMMPQKWM